MQHGLFHEKPENGPSTYSSGDSSSTTTPSVYDDAIPYIEQAQYVDLVATPPRVVDAPVALQTTPPVRVQEIPIEVAHAAPERGNRAPGWMIALLTLFSLLLIVGGSGFLTYATAFRPGELHAQATAAAQNFLTAQTQSTAQANTAATATANTMTPDQVYNQVTSEKPLIDDPLQDDSGDVWLNYGSYHGASCGFNGGAYHVSLAIQGGNFCIGAGTQFDNVAFQAQIMVIKGNDGGLIFRFAPDANGNLSGYDFAVDTQGRYYFVNYMPTSQSKVLKQGICPLFTTGINQANTLTVIARGSSLYLYVNGANVVDMTDTTYTAGQLAFIGESYAGDEDVAFSNVKVWAL
jgi:Domain of Unknown Function (DUF1080)